MSQPAITVDAVNMNEIVAAFRDTPQLAQQYISQEMGRAANRVRRRFIQQRLNGPPGIRGGVWKQQAKRHVKTWVEGEDLGTLQASIRISRFLRLHETGGVITASHKGRDMLRLPIGDRMKLPARGGFDIDGHIRGLFFLRRQGKAPLLVQKSGDRIIPRFVLKSRVVMKPRLGFQETVTREWPKEFPRIGAAAERAMRVALERRMKTITNAVSTLTGV